MTGDRYDRPEPGTSDWHEPLNENFRDLDSEVVAVVDEWDDLPEDAADVERSSNGQWPRFYVLEDRVQVRVTDEATEILGGLGSAARPLPRVRATAADVTEARIEGTDHVTIDVPGDAEDFRTAFEIASTVYRSRDAEVRINFESGHRIQTGIQPRHGNWSHVRLVSEDDRVAVADAFPDDENLIDPGPGAYLPVLDTVIDMNGQGINGIMGARGCHLYVADGAGVVDAGRHNLMAIGTRVGCSAGPLGTVWTGAGERGMMITNGALATIPGVDVSNCGDDGLYVSRGSMCYAEPLTPHGEGPDVQYAPTTANDCGDAGIRVRRSFAVVRFAEATNNDVAGLWIARNSRVEAERADLSGNGTGLRAGHGSTVDAEGADLSDADGAAAHLDKGATGVLVGADLSNPGGPRGLVLRLKSEAVCTDATLGTGELSATVFLREGSTVDLTGATIDGSTPDPSHVDGAPAFNEVTGPGIVFHDA